MSELRGLTEARQAGVWATGTISMEPGSLRTDLVAIGQAAILAVDPEQLVRRRLTLVADGLALDGRPLVPPCRIDPIGRVVIVGGGKAAAALAQGVAEMLIAGGLPTGRLSGLVSVPEGFGRSIPGVTVIETRPPGVNLPTPRAVAASREMLAMVESLSSADLVLAVITGGGSAVLTAPRPGISLEEKVATAAFLAAAGADIRELNVVRRAASEIKGGGLARACSAGRLVALVLSDVIGDPLEFISSGPCLPGTNAAAARDVLVRYAAFAAGVAPGLAVVLEDDLRRGKSEAVTVSATGSWTTAGGCRVDHLLLGNNATAVEAAARTARSLGYEVTVRHALPGRPETADEVGLRLAREGLGLAATNHTAWAIIEGGEAVVRLPSAHGRGGRNQQTAVAALLQARGHGGWPSSLALASLGTDGEDGPTTAAGGFVDGAVAAAIDRQNLDLAHAVANCDAHPLLAATAGLIETGPTGTNVADLRIMLARP